MYQGVKLIAHAGFMGTKPNSIESIIEALKYTMDALEVDVRFNENSEAVLSHDPIDPIKPLVKLEEVIALIKAYKVDLNLDIKENEGLENAIALITNAGLNERCFLTGQCPKLIQREWLKNNSIKYLYNSSINDSLINEKTINTLIDEAIIVGAFGLNLCYKVVSPSIVNKVKQAGLKLYVWTLDNKEAIDEMISMGVDSITITKPLG